MNNGLAVFTHLWENVDGGVVELPVDDVWHLDDDAGHDGDEAKDLSDLIGADAAGEQWTSLSEQIGLYCST